MADALPVLAAALIAGLVGSAHCVGMCGGLSGLFAMHASATGLQRHLPMALAYNLGRLASYALLGFAVAAAGSGVVAAMPGLARPVRLLAGAVMILIGLQIALDLRLLAPIEKAGGRLWRFAAPAARRLLPVTSVPRALGLGLAWGLLPCGLVYSVLLVAATSGGPGQGAAAMFVFGLGTTPAMLATGIGAARLSAWMRDRRTRAGFGLVVVLIGVVTLLLPVAGLFSAGGPAHGHH